MKPIGNICQICQATLNLSRREIHAIAVAVRQAAKDRYFVPDEEVHAIVHRIHNKPNEEKS